MSVMVTEISVFARNSRKIEADIRDLLPKQAVDKLAERLGAEAGDKATKALKQMKALDSDLIQFRVDDRRVRIKTVAK